jgi:hypothetical protein
LGRVCRGWLDHVSRKTTIVSNVTSFYRERS